MVLVDGVAVWIGGGIFGLAVRVIQAQQHGLSLSKIRDAGAAR